MTNFIMITAFRGYTSPLGNKTVVDVMTEIKNGQYKTMIERICKAMDEGNLDSADRIKKQLPFVTATANYKERRLPWGIMCYNRIITIDIDHLEEDQIERVRKAIEACPHTLACFLSPRRKGLKVLIYLDTPEVRKLIIKIEELSTIRYRELEMFHEKLYEMCRIMVETIADVEVDASGKDIGRGFYVSHDPNAYLNMGLLNRTEPLKAVIVAPEKGESKKCGPKMPWVDLPARAIKDIEPWMKYEFGRAQDSARKKGGFKDGNRDNFMYALGLACFRKKITPEATMKLAKYHYGASGFAFEQPLMNGYRYNDRSEEDKPKKKRTIDQVLEFLGTNYCFRRNVVADRLEFARKDVENENAPIDYRPMEEQDFNSVFCQAHLADLRASKNYIQSVINSDQSPAFHPFRAYFCNLPAWDGQDHIAQLADSVTTTDQNFWRDALKRWLVGMTACAINERITNQHALMLYSNKQGIGKSSWVQKILPPELYEYSRTGMIDFNAKDHSMLLSTHLLINLDEFDGVRRDEVAALKRIITIGAVTERKAYAHQAKQYERRASFIASTNNRQCLQDIEGNRRFLVSTVTDIDLSYEPNYKQLYAQVVYLLNNNYQYWYAGKEINELNERNEDYRQRDTVEELFYVRFRPATKSDYAMKWMSAGHIVSRLNIMARLPITPQTQSTITRLLEKDGFMRRKSVSNIFEYAVYEFCEDEIHRKAVK